MYPRSAQRFIGAAACVVLATSLLAGCSQKEEETPPPTTVVTTATPTGATTTTSTPSGTVVATTPPGPVTNNTNAGPGGSTGTDQATADDINKAIHTNVQMTGSRITTVVTAGEARLTGTAQNAQQKALAERTARDNSGVTNVINKVEIVPTGGIKAPQPKPKVITKTITHTIVVPGPPAPPAPPSDTTTAPDGTGSVTTTTTDTTGGTSTNP